MRILVLIVLSVLSANCVAPAKNSYELYNDSVKYEAKVRYVAYKALQFELETKIKDQIVGGEYFITSKPFCHVYSNEDMTAENEKIENEYKDQIMGIRTRISLSKDELKTDDSKLPNFMNKIKVIDAKLLISWAFLKSSKLMPKVDDQLDFKWNGSGVIYLIVEQDNKSFVLKSYLSDGLNSLKLTIPQLFFDGNDSGSDRIDCLSKSNPINTYNLSVKDLAHIKANTYYIGMSSKALTFSQGSPYTINNTRVANSLSQQWVYRAGQYTGKDKYFYFTSGKLRSWQD
jgi:hypothetical protein